MTPERATTRAFATVGVGCIVAGGLIAAVTGPLSLEHGSWLAAYLVLVGGVAQYAMGRARVWFPRRAQPQLWGWVGFLGWNVGNAAVIVGTLLGLPPVVYLGSALLVATLLIALDATRPLSGSARDSDSRLLGWAYRTMLLVLAVSIPVGMTLSHLRHS